MKWQNPPESVLAQPKSKHALIARQLRSRPGQWALIAENVSEGMTSYVRNGMSSAYRPAGTFEARSVPAGEKFDIYARFVGEGSAA